ncbi:MAG: HAD-IC family P-type ATPase [Bacteroidales bacterium]
MAEDSTVYRQSIEDVAKSVSTDINNGLTESDANTRLKDYGKNQLESEDHVSLIMLFIKQFNSVVMLLLTSAAVASFLIGEVVEGIAVLVVILITAIVGLIMEYRAGKSIEALKQTVKDEVTVLRDGKKHPCLTENIVKGDIVILDEGDKVPADGRLISNQGLSVDESMLTGESDMVDKTTEPLEDNTTLADRKNMVFMGSHVVKGDATYIVTATALDTEMGHISSLLKDTKDEDTPLEKRLEQTGRFLIVLTLIIAAIVAVVGILTGNSIESMVKTSIALAIAAVPEGLPAAATITLAIGMKRMAKKNALLRNLPAVETLGSATIFCTDKTGTITENEMTVKRLVTLNKTIEIKGTGYVPQGDFKEKNRPFYNRL